MVNQSGGFAFLLVFILVIILGISIYFFSSSNVKKSDEHLPVQQVSQRQVEQVKPLVLNTDKLKAFGIEVQFPERGELQEISSDNFAWVKGIKANSAYKYYYNINQNIDGVDKEYSGLTLFIIEYPNVNNLLLIDLLPQTIKDDKNQTDTIEKIKIGVFQGYKHTQCCYSGGVEEFYFLNADGSKLILIKAYNYGPDHNHYNEKLKTIIGSIRVSL